MHLSSNLLLFFFYFSFLSELAEILKKIPKPKQTKKKQPTKKKTTKKKQPTQNIKKCGGAGMVS